MQYARGPAPPTLSGWLVTCTMNQPERMRSNSVTSNDTSYVRPSESRTWRTRGKEEEQPTGVTFMITVVMEADGGGAQ
mgnify:CR=1 FL=1